MLQSRTSAIEYEHEQEYEHEHEEQPELHHAPKWPICGRSVAVAIRCPMI
ncbi:MAG: hypothetical protein ACOYKN_16365 [Pirellula sp.]